ncbi:hypothetical protein LBMAG42_08090 [Deltaproteobacteria bacterium]|nr:hypothetical protein LBMAG42_08090 [Deltaproteobacteria bacterium]
MLPSVPIDIRRPELRAEVIALIDLVCHGQVDGELRVPVEELVRTLGIPVAAAFHEQLAERGDLHFAGDAFVNGGRPIVRNVKFLGLTGQLEIAATLRGELHRAVDRFTLTFEPGASFRLGRRIFETELRRLEVTPTTVRIVFSPIFELRVHLEASA